MEKVANVLHTKANVPLVTNALTRPSNNVYHNSIPKKYFKISWRAVSYEWEDLPNSKAFSCLVVKGHSSIIS